jgi:hypothetical protein
MVEIRRILCPIDFSDYSRRARDRVDRRVSGATKKGQAHEHDQTHNPDVPASCRKLELSNVHREHRVPSFSNKQKESHEVAALAVAGCGAPR